MFPTLLWKFFITKNYKQFGLFYLSMAIYVVIDPKQPEPTVLAITALMSAVLLFMHVFPTLSLPFGAFADSEAVEKLFLQYLGAPSAGVLLGELLRCHPIPWAAVVILQLAFLAVVSFWSNSVLSQQWRWELWLRTDPSAEEVRKFAMMRANGEADKADTLIRYALLIGKIG